MTILQRPWRTLALAVFAAIALLILVSSPSSAHAAAATPVVESTDSPAAGIVFAPTWVQLVSLLVTVVLPVLVGLVTRRETNPGRKAIYLAALAAITGLGSELLTALTDGTTYDLATGLYTAVGAFAVATALHYGLWKPTGVSARAQGLGSSTSEADRVPGPDHRAS